MITLALCCCDDNPQSRHEIGEHLRDEMLFALTEGFDRGRITRLPGGKPVLDGCAFSVSHSGRLVCCAVAAEQSGITFGEHTLHIPCEACDSLGVDVEKITHFHRCEEIANRFFTPRERAFVGKDTRRFYEVWTKKEAACKKTGAGLSALRGTDTLESKNIHTFCHTAVDGEYVISVAF